MTQRVWLILLLTSACALLAGLGMDVMDVDAAQYAEISGEMLHRGDWLRITYRGVPYLDKPPLIFWLSAPSIWAFGHTAWAYKLPAMLLTLWGAWAAFGIGKKLFGPEQGRWAALIWLTSLACLSFNQDLRTDAPLTAFVTLSLHALISYTIAPSPRWAILSGLFLGLAMLSKGPIGLIAPLLAIGPPMLLSRDWNPLRRGWWLLALPVIALVLMPMCIGLYQQWGLHGLRFFFWTQSFGRITGENQWQNGAPPWFFAENYLWNALPWTVLGMAALAFALKNLRADLRTHWQRAVPFFGFILVIAALSLSRYKLPHYVYCVYPLLALMLARYLTGVRWPAWLRMAQYGILTLLLMAGLAGALYVFGLQPFALAAIVITLGLAGYLLRQPATTQGQRLAALSILTSAGVWLSLNLGFYPQLSQYQAGVQALKVYRIQPDAAAAPIYGYQQFSLAMDYASGLYIPYISYRDSLAIVAQAFPAAYIYADTTAFADLTALSIPHRSIARFPDFPISRLNLHFLHPQTRGLDPSVHPNAPTRWRYLIRMGSPLVR